MSFFTGWKSKIGDALVGLIPTVSSIVVDVDGTDDDDLLGGPGDKSLYVTTKGSGTLVSMADVTLSAGAAAALPSQACKQGVTVQSDPANSYNIRVGGSATDASHGFVVQPGQSVRFAVSNANLVSLYCAYASQVVHPVAS